VVDDRKIYKLVGVNVAIELLRPGAKWEFNGTAFTKWDDPRPVPSVEEVYDVMKKLKDFEDSIPTMWTPEQLASMKTGEQDFESATA